MAIRLVQGTIQFVDATVTDATEALTDLDSASPTYTVAFVDPVTKLDDTPIYDSAPATSTGMVIQALLDTTTGGSGDDAPKWARGKYHLYVGFTYGDEVPLLGPITFYII